MSSHADVLYSPLQLLFYHSRMRRVYIFSRVCLCVCLSLCPIRPLTTERLDLETSFLVSRYVFRISRSNFNFSFHFVRMHFSFSTVTLTSSKINTELENKTRRYFASMLNKNDFLLRNRIVNQSNVKLSMAIRCEIS